MKTNQILDIAIYAGSIILKNGGETYRTEETIEHIFLPLSKVKLDLFFY